mmetsp:Transcript_6593/g.11099  ORF Transcript_6593/g.11099 Transcript_6593/m.11099 type:complete len:201 (-) Transcript_6593:264-866(-)
MRHAHLTVSHIDITGCFFESAYPVKHSIQKGSFINITVAAGQNTYTFHLAVTPLADIFVAVAVSLHAPAVPHAFFVHTHILCPVAAAIHSPALSLAQFPVPHIHTPIAIGHHTITVKQSPEYISNQPRAPEIFDFPPGEDGVNSEDYLLGGGPDVNVIISARIAVVAVVTQRCHLGAEIHIVGDDFFSRNGIAQGLLLGT